MKTVLLYCIFILFFGLSAYEFYSQAYITTKNTDNSILAIITKKEEKEQQIKEKKINYDNFEYVEH